MEQRHFCDTKKETHLILPECECDCSSCQSYRSCLVAARVAALPSTSPSPSKSVKTAAEMIANGTNPQTLLIQAIMDLTEAIRQATPSTSEENQIPKWMRDMKYP